MSTIALYISQASRVTRRLDRVALAIVLLAAAIALLLPDDRAAESFRFTAASLIWIAPFLVASALAAAYLGAAGADTLISRVFQGRPVAVIVAAALFGGLSPFCSCGVIPLIAALLAAGVPLPAVMAFWLASPIMDPEMYVLTAGGLGVQFATAKTIAAVGIGLFGGFATLAVVRLGGFRAPLKGGGVCGGCGVGTLPAGRHLWAFWHEAQRRAQFSTAFRGTLVFLGKWLLLAFMLESLMVMYLPAETVSHWLGAGSAWAIPLSVAVGVPAYMNGYAAIPLVAGLMESGMAPGPAMAFMTAGAITSIPAAIAVFALVKRPVFVWYLVLAAAGSVFAGAAFQAYAG